MREVKDTAKAVRRAFDPKLTSDPHILSKAIATWWLHEEPAPPPVLPLVQAPGARRASDAQHSPPRAAAAPEVAAATTSGPQELNLVSRRDRSGFRPSRAPGPAGMRRARRAARGGRLRRFRDREPSRKQDAARRPARAISGSVPGSGPSPSYQPPPPPLFPNPWQIREEGVLVLWERCSC